ncbi:PAS domain S-box protein, partial [Methanoregula sp.]|uniref:PAS domain S-box protein n=1 Tax=Methanoregula sp. TaxID=2052170 RepID=UPI0025F2AD7D
MKKTGGNLEDLIRKYCWEIFHGPGTTRPPEGCPFETMLRSCHHETSEMEVELFGGTYLVSCTPVFDETGKLDRVIHIATDITDRKQAEEELRRRNDELRASYEQIAAAEEELRDQVEMLAESEKALRQQEEKIRSIFRVAPVGIGMVVNRVIKEANDTLCRMTGYSHEELVGQDTRMLYLTQKEYDHAGAEMYRQIRGKGTETVATRWKRRDSTVIDVLLSLTALDPADLNRGVTFSVLDVTGSRRADHALRESEDRYRQLFEHANDGITIAQDGRFISFNSRFARMLGYAPEELTGKPIVSVIHPDDRTSVIDRHIGRLQGEKGLPDVYTFRILTRENRVLWVELNTSVISWEGRPATLNIVRDITERRQAEEELRESEERYRSLLA